MSGPRAGWSDHVVQAPRYDDELRLERARLADEARLELARLKAEFLTTISHELRTPLSLVHGYAELLADRAASLSPADVAQMGGEILAGSRTLVRLVDNLLDFSRLDRERLERRRVEIADVLTDAVAALQARPGGERVVAELARPPEHLAADVDPDRLRQIVEHLLVNALTYAPDGPIVLRADERDGMLRVEVEDQGPGLSSDDQRRIWESFYRGPRAACSPHRGSGLGLAVVKQLVDLHGGQVGVRSAPGRGACFWFTLPRPDARPAGTGASDQPSPVNGVSRTA